MVNCPVQLLRLRKRVSGVGIRCFKAFRYRKMSETPEGVFNSDMGEL